jgi:hypothetical protein
VWNVFTYSQNGLTNPYRLFAEEEASSVSLCPKTAAGFFFSIAQLLFSAFVCKKGWSHGAF